MDKYIRLHRNMRINALLIMGLIALLLICSDADSALLLIGTKVAGFILTAIAFKLARRWHRAGLLKEVDEFINGED